MDGQRAWLTSANYRLPVTVGKVRVDCPITKGYTKNSSSDAWGLEKDARLRLWPAGSPLMNPGTFVYPIRQRWFASSSQMANEPCYVDHGDQPKVKKIYYHYGLDFGGCEGMTEILAATDGLVVSARKEALARLQGHAGQSAVRRGLRARRPRLVLSLQPLLLDRQGDQAGRPRQGGPAARAAWARKAAAAGGRTSTSTSSAASPRANGAARRPSALSGRRTRSSTSPSSSPWPGRTSSS